MPLCAATTPAVLAAVLAAVLVCLVPSAAAGIPYEGPGQEGTVPLGDGGHSLGLPGDVADNRTYVALAGFPLDTCRIELVDQAPYDATHLHWSNNSTIAYVYAEPGALEAPYRVRAHWRSDVNGACTAEVNPNGTTWHDPRGRPFTQLAVNDTKVFLAPTVGQVVRISADVANSGTVPAKVTSSVKIQQDGWEVRGAAPSLDVPVDPEGTTTFWYDVFVPRTQKAVMNTLVVSFQDGKEWHGEVTFFLDLQKPPPQHAQGDEAALRPALDTGVELDHHGLPKWEPETVETPGPGAPFGLIMLALVGFLRRVAPESGARPVRT